MHSVMIALGLAGIGYTLILLCLQSFHLGMLPSFLFGGSLLAILFIPPGWIQTLLICHCVFWILFAAGSLIVSIVGGKKASPAAGSTPGLLMVLGYQLQRGQMSTVLIRRLEKALDLARRYPDARIILSGGQPVAGPSEARVMSEWMQASGIPESRLLLEESSGSSYQNMVCSKKIWENLGCPETWIVTSAFHAFRAYGSAGAAGLHAHVISSSSPPFTYPAEILREGILWVKTVLFGYASMAWANGKL